LPTTRREDPNDVVDEHEEGGATSGSPTGRVTLTVVAVLSRLEQVGRARVALEEVWAASVTT
jgi:hypothetical protein